MNQTIVLWRYYPEFGRLHRGSEIANHVIPAKIQQDDVPPKFDGTLLYPDLALPGRAIINRYRAIPE